MSHTDEWKSSSFCADGACAQVKTSGETVSVRSTTEPDTVVVFTIAEWEALKAGIRNGEF
jgi:hypothetical protein